MAHIIYILRQQVSICSRAGGSVRLQNLLRDRLFSELTTLATALCPVLEFKFLRNAALTSSLRRRLDHFIDETQFPPPRHMVII